MSHLPALSSCTHTVWGHLRHPLCPSIPLWQKASMVGIAIIATYGGFLWLTRDSSTSDAKQIRYNNSQTRVYQSKCPSFHAGLRAFDHTLLLILNKGLSPKNFTNQLGGKVQQPSDTNMLFFARVLDEQKTLLKESIIKKSWQNPSTLEQAKKTMEAAYCLAFLALDELTTIEKDSRQQILSSDDHYYRATILDFFSLYHAIRSAGVINIDANGFTTYTGSSDNLNTPYADIFYNNLTVDQRHLLRDLYNHIVLRFDAEGLSIPKDWPAFEEDKVVTNYDCPLPYMDHPKHIAAATTVETSPADDRFSPAIREIFSNLGINVDTLPVLENSKEELSKPEDLNAPIMKFTSKGSNHPNIAIKLRCENENATSLLILGKQDADKWSQRQREDFGLHPRFFNVGQFTNEQGKLVAPANSIAELKKILAGGDGTALNGKVWKLAE